MLLAFDSFTIAGTVTVVPKSVFVSDRTDGPTLKKIR